MATTISTNIPSLNAQRHLSVNQAGLATTMQRLSSGLRVNSAKDDAAGLAISERMLAQAKGMDVAKRNAHDGISLAQVAEGAMHKMTDILQRGRELAVQAANGTNSKTDREALFAEYSQLLQEVARMSRDSNFNGHKLLDGSFTAQTFQVGANAGQTIGVTVPALKENTLGPYQAGTSLAGDSAMSYAFYYSQGFDAWAATTLPANGRTITVQDKVIPVDGDQSMAAIADKVKAQDFDPEIQTEVRTSIGFTVPPVSNGQITLSLVAGENYGKARTVSFPWDGSDTSALAAMQAINAVASETGVRAEDFLPANKTIGIFSNGVQLPFFRLTNDAGENLHVMNASNPPVTINLSSKDWDEQGLMLEGELFSVTSAGNAGVFGVHDGFVIGGLSLTSDQPFRIEGDAHFDIDGTEVGLIHAQGAAGQVKLNQVSFDTPRSASNALRIFDAAINQVTMARANLGAVQSRFESVISNLDIASENTVAARSRIVDADFAIETAQLARQQIQQNAGMAMVAQANSAPQQVLALLKSV